MTNTQVAITVVMCARLVVSAMLSAFRITWGDGDVKDNLARVRDVEGELEELCRRLFVLRKREMDDRR